MSLCQVQKNLSRLLLLDLHPSSCSCCHCFPLLSSSSSSSSPPSSVSTTSPNPDRRSTYPRQHRSHNDPHHHLRHRQCHHSQQQAPSSKDLTLTVNHPDMADFHSQMVHSILATGCPTETQTWSPSSSSSPPSSSSSLSSLSSSSPSSSSSSSSPSPSLLLFSSSPVVESLKQRSAKAALYSPSVSAATILHCSATSTTTKASHWGRVQDLNQRQKLQQQQDSHYQGPDLVPSLILSTQSQAHVHARAVVGQQATAMMTTKTTTTTTTRARRITKARLSATYLRQKRIPYYASCFSPLDLPWEIFVLLMRFLTPGDLWTLCQVSRAMQFHVSRFMNKSQRFEYGAARILHQEHADTMRDPSRTSAALAATASAAMAGRAGGYSRMETGATLTTSAYSTTLTDYMSMTQRASSFSIASSAETLAKRRAQREDVQSRSTYWKAQALCLVSTMAEDSMFESSLAQKASDGGLNDFDRDFARMEYGIAPFSPSPPSPSPSSHLPLDESSPLSPLSSLSVIAANMATIPKGISTHDRTVAWPLSLDRVQSVVDLLFDPSIVRLNHRRAIINCARYIAAEVEDISKRASMTYGYNDPKTHARIMAKFTVETGPYLTLVTPAHVDSGRGLSAATTTTTTTTTSEATTSATGTTDTAASTTTTAAPTTTTCESTRSRLVSPPKDLSGCSYFQIMLWHRCMSDLVSLYNRIQHLHFESSRPKPPTKKTTSPSPSEKSPIPATARSRPRLQRGAVCCQDTILSRDERSEKRPPTVATESYPFCCKGHSLVYTTQYTSGGLFPVSFRHGLRQLTRRIQAVSGLDLWTFAFGTQTEEPQIRCTIEYCGPTEQLQFCRASIDPTITSETQTSPSSFKASMTTATTTTTATRSRLREKSVVEDEDYAYAGFGYLEDSSDEDEETLTQEHINHELVQRRYRIEERMRQDTLIKQELLGLCHMACGLFQEENRAARAPPTIMSLLRKGSPWSKGTWREGEWRHDCVDYTSMAGSYQGSSSSKGAPSLPNIAQVEQGEWQKLCIATIEFLALQSLRWGGNTANAELSRLRTSVGPNAWIYHE